MVTLSQILTAITSLIARDFPDRTFYIGQLPEPFQRPSFFLQLVTSNSIRQSIGAGQTDYYLTLTIYGQLEEGKMDAQTSLWDEQDTILNLFRLGTLHVADRTLPIAVANGGQNRGEAYVEMTVTLRDGVGYDPEVGIDLIQEVTARTILAEKGGDQP